MNQKNNTKYAEKSMGSGSIDHALRMFFPSLFQHIAPLLLLLTLTPLPLFAAETAPAEKQADEAFEARVSKLLKESRSSPLVETVARVRKGVEGVPPSTPEGQEAVTRYYQRKYQGLKTDVSELHALLEKAAAKDDSEAMVILGLLVYSGQGVFPDHERGLKLLNRARDLGNPAASFHLAYTHFDEYSAKFDFDTARKYLKEAKKRGHAMADYGWAQLLEKKRRFREARDIYLEYATKGYPQAYVSLAYLYIDGKGNKGTTQDKTRGTQLLNSAFRLGWPNAIYQLGMTHLDGISETSDRKLFYKYNLTASELNHPDALHALCIIHKNGLLGIAKNKEKAIEYCKMSSDLGAVRGAIDTAEFYRNKGGKQQNQEYIKWINISNERGNGISLSYLASDLIDGKNGYKQDFEKAYNASRESATSGYPQGMILYAFLSSGIKHKLSRGSDYPTCYIWSELYIRSLGIYGIQSGSAENSKKLRNFCRSKISESEASEAEKFIIENSYSYTSSFWANYYRGTIGHGRSRPY